MQKVLIVTYYWPPGSGAGVQRWLKFSKYLTKLGWEAVLLTVDPDFAVYSAIDHSLNNEVPANLTVYKTRARDYFRLYKKDKSKIPSAGFAIDEEKGFVSHITRFIRGNFFIPDPRRGWNRFAFKKACEIIETRKIDHVITTSPPHSTQLIGLKLKKKYPEIQWIADLRDPWTDIYYYDKFYPTFLSKRIDSAYEKSVLISADKIITIGKSLKELFSSKIPGIEEKIEVISNGYDEEDFSALIASKPGIFTISYVGTLSGSYPINGFLKSLKLLNEDGINFRLRFAAVVSQEHKELISSATGGSNIEFIPYSGHLTAIRNMLDASVLLLIIPDHLSSRSIITGKLFEYLASGKPVICLGPVDGDAAKILEETGHGKTFDYNDSAGISEYLTILSSNPEITKKVPHTIYSRENLVKKVIAL
ncbi:MAG: glycosyltransferase family 4 protein, partial [Bacteroidia bacterium]|nr:glycosyltransferase family 4 protein [Bacteroidia bacterium]